jgi:hypothetical protein
MSQLSALILWCGAWAAAAAETPPETFVIHSGRSGREATIIVPVGAVAAFSASNAEAVPNTANPQVEEMRLRGDVRISVAGANQPIQIKADSVLLELTADETSDKSTWFRLESVHRSRSTEVIAGEGNTQTFEGDVVFTVPTPSGAMRIMADRVEHTAAPAAGS